MPTLSSRLPQIVFVCEVVSVSESQTNVVYKVAVGGCIGSTSLSGLVIGVLSVSWSSELLLSFSALRNTSTPLLMRSSSNPLTHDQHTQCYWPQLTLILVIWVLVWDNTTDHYTIIQTSHYAHCLIVLQCVTTELMVG